MCIRDSYYMGLNARNGMLGNEKSREAMKYLVDYQGIADTISRGTMEVHQTMIPRGFLGALDYNPYKYDLEKAKDVSYTHLDVYKRQAEKIAAGVQAAGGSMTVEDLANYKAVMRDPVHGTYRGYEIVSMPPPSSGGVHIVQILNVLEGYPIGFLGHNSAKTIHLMAEAMKYAYADRSEYLGDSDYVDVPMSELISKEYAASIREQISLTAVRPSADIKPGDLAPYESNQTTHFSVVDKDGNAVSNTYTLNFPYGAGLIADGTGIFMNNEMDDFSAKPGVPNGYGPVSYTHLDVYKRQDWISPCGSSISALLNV